MSPRRMTSPSHTADGNSRVLPLLVYAAREGYTWVAGRNDPKREGFRRAAGSTPSFDMGDCGVSGVTGVGEHILVYRFMREEAADSKGRSGAYLVMTYFPKVMGREINADSVLSQPAFATPQPHPPSTIRFLSDADAASSWTPPEASTKGVWQRSGSLAGACVAVATVGDALRVFRKDGGNDGCSFFDYRKNEVPSVKSPPVQPPPAAVAPSVEPVPCDSPSGMSVRMVCLLVALAFVAGVWCGSNSRLLGDMLKLLLGR